MAAPVKRGSSLRLTFAAVLLASLALERCATLRVPAEAPTFTPEVWLKASKARVSLEISPIQGRDKYWELFDDDLPQIGIVALWVRLHNSTEGALKLDGLNWKLMAGAGTFSEMDTQAIFKRFYRGRRIRVYSIDADRRARRKLEDLMFTRGPLAPSMTRAGFVFLRIDPKRAHDWSQGGKLIANGIRLASGEKMQIELPMPNANS